MLFSYKVKLVAVLISLLCIYFTGVSQTSISDCNEKPDSPKKLFVFIGELLKTETIPDDDLINNPKLIATYKIIERVCGIYLADSITMEVIQSNYDSTFKKHPTHLVISMKDTSLNATYKLWRNLYYEVFKTANNKWAVPYRVKDHEYQKYGVKPLKSKRIKFSVSGFYELKGMTQEEIDITYPKPFYKVEKDKSYPKYGNTIQQILQHEKQDNLLSAGIFEPLHPESDILNPNYTIHDVELEGITQKELDSTKNVKEKELLAIKDSLEKSPLNEELLKILIQNCRERDDFSYCDEYFENITRNYPDSINAYLIKAKLKHTPVTLKDTSRILLYQQALSIDSSNYLIHYNLAESYYQLFHEKQTAYYANAARKSLIKCTEIDNFKFYTLKYAIIQLSNYLSDTVLAKKYSNLIYSFNHHTNKAETPIWYYPIDSFFNSITNWSTDYSINVFWKIKSLSNKLDYYSSVLEWLNEPKFKNYYNNYAYRFLWTRRFHMPIVIRMEKTNRNICIYWKQSHHDESTDTYEPGQLFQKIISSRQWNKFENMLAKIDYWSMYVMDKSDIMDGSHWILEANINGKYKITERQGSVYKQYTDCLKYLIRLTDLKIPKKEIY